MVFSNTQLARFTDVPLAKTSKANSANKADVLPVPWSHRKQPFIHLAGDWRIGRLPPSHALPSKLDTAVSRYAQKDME